MDSRPHYHKHYVSISLGAFNHWTFLAVGLICLTLFVTATRLLMQ